MKKCIGFYLDEHVPRATAVQLSERGYTVVRAVEAGMAGKDDDADHLPYAIQHGLVMVTFDRPFAGRVMQRRDHPGFIHFNDSIKHDIGQQVELLMIYAETYDPDRDAGVVLWLP